MEKRVIKIGTKVSYRGGFEHDAPTIVTIQGIERSKCKRDKYGEPVDEIPFKDREYGCFDLDNGHWCYGEQIDAIVEDKEETIEPEEEMEVRITWRSEIYIKGKNIDEIKEKWENTRLFSADALELNADFVELVSAERVDDDSYDDVYLG